ncbi:hypothetical protein WDU94_014010, partial [Cyamophila willieti]
FKKKIQILEEAVSKLLRQIEFCSPFKLQSETVNKLTKVNNVTQTNNELPQINNEKLHEINTCVPQTNNVLIYETKNIQGRTEPTHLNELVDISEGYDSDRTEFEFPVIETKQIENNETAKNDEDSDCTEFEFPFKDMEKESDISSERDQKENGNVTDIKTKHAILFQNTAHQGNQASGKTNSKETNLEAAKQNDNQDEIQQDGEKPNQPVTKDKNGTSAIENIKNSRDIEIIDLENVHISVPHSPLLLKSFNRNRKNLSATCASNKYEHNGDHTFDKNKFELYSTMNTTLDSIFEIQTSPMQSKVIDSNKTDTNADTISFLCPVSGIFKVQGSLSELNKEGDRINQLEQTSDLLAQSDSLSETTKLKQMSKFNANMKKETIGILQKDGLTLATNRDQNKVEKENVESFQHAKMIENGKLVNRSQPIISSKNRETNYKTTDTNANIGYNVQLDLNTRKTDPKEIQMDLFVPMKQSHEIPNDSPSAANSAEPERMKDRTRNLFIAKINANDGTANQLDSGHSKYYGQSQPESSQYTQRSRNKCTQNPSTQRFECLNNLCHGNLSQNQQNSKHYLATNQMNFQKINSSSFNGSRDSQVEEIHLLQPEHSTEHQPTINPMTDIQTTHKLINSIMDIETIAKPIYFTPEPGDETSATWTLEDLKMFT